MNHFSDGTYGSAVKEHTLFDQSQSDIEKRLAGKSNDIVAIVFERCLQWMRFFKFHDENPHVYKEFERRALLLINKGRRHFGAKAIFEAMRFDWAATTTDEEFKLNNNYTAYYARMFEDKHPDYVGFFEMRTQKE